MFLKKYKERKKAKVQKRKELVDRLVLIRQERSVRIKALRVELGIASWKADEDFYEELFTILKTMKDRLDSLEEKQK
jgi:hypothetical protein